MIDQVSLLLRQVASSTIMPRFRRLTRAEIEEKEPGDLVTIADREAEAIIAPQLVALLPGSRVVGEEAAALRPSLMSDIDKGSIWLVDPLDGTANFAAGRTPFALMIALLSKGETVAAWILDPVADTLAVAERGSGAWLGDERVHARSGSPGPSALRGAVFTRFMPPDIEEAIVPRLSMIGEALPGYMCCGAEYPAIATGEEDFALFWRTQPWDHAPGTLFLTEAGGHVARPNGDEYRPGSKLGGLLAARGHEVWNDAQTALISLRA